MSEKCNINKYRDAIINALKNSGRFNNIYVLNNTSGDILAHNNMSGALDRGNVHIIINNGDISEPSRNSRGLVVDLDIYIVLVYNDIMENNNEYFSKTNDKVNEDVTFITQLLYRDKEVNRLSKNGTYATGFANLSDEKLTQENLSGAIVSFTGRIYLVD